MQGWGESSASGVFLFRDRRDRPGEQCPLWVGAEGLGLVPWTEGPASSWGWSCSGDTGTAGGWLSPLVGMASIVAASSSSTEASGLLARVHVQELELKLLVLGELGLLGLGVLGLLGLEGSWLFGLEKLGELGLLGLEELGLLGLEKMELELLEVLLAVALSSSSVAV